MTEIMKSQENPYSLIENIIATGDLSKLTDKQRVEYYQKTCDSLGLNQLTRPFEYQKFNGKTVLYARKECTEQLRFMHKVSIIKLEKEVMNDCYVVTAYARTADGKEDAATGAVSIAGLKGEALSNAYMKAETKAKRRVTLSVCGLGFTDESEIASIPNAQPVHVNHDTGEIIESVKVITEYMAPSRSELIEGVASARTLTVLKDQYAKAYQAHAGNLEQMKDITELKDIRKKQIEEFDNAKREQAYDEPFPVLAERAYLNTEHQS